MGSFLRGRLKTQRSLSLVCSGSSLDAVNEKDQKTIKVNRLAEYMSSERSEVML